MWSAGRGLGQTPQKLMKNCENNAYVIGLLSVFTITTNAQHFTTFPGEGEQVPPLPMPAGAHGLPEHILVS